MRTPTAGRHVRWPLVCILILAAAAVLGQPAAHAHVQDGSAWLFEGHTFEDTDGGPGDVKDPVNLIFYGGAGLLDVTNARVINHLEADWPQMFKSVCNSHQRMKWRNVRSGARKHDREDWTRMTSGCRGEQFHLRMWDDWEHSLITSHRRYSWVVGGVHHEKRHGLGHKPNRDWDDVRVQAVRQLKEHCRERHWQFHAGAHREYQEYWNDGWIGRISLRHAINGCNGA